MGLKEKPDLFELKFLILNCYMMSLDEQTYLIGLQIEKNIFQTSDIELTF